MVRKLSEPSADGFQDYHVITHCELHVPGTETIMPSLSGITQWKGQEEVFA